MSEFNQPLISVDSVVLRLHNGAVQVLLIKRWADPFAGEWALPGVLLGPGESIDSAVKRALADKADIQEVMGMKQIAVFDKTNRDPRGATISISCYGFIPSNCETSGKWFAIKDLHELPFDHNSIINSALEQCAFPDGELLLGILGKVFTSSDFMDLVEYAGRTIDRSNITRILPVLYPNIRKVSMKGRKMCWSLGGTSE